MTKTEVVRVQGWTIDHVVMGYPHLLLYVALVAREGALTASQSYCPLINT